LYLAASGCQVHLVIRGDRLDATMSAYLINRLVDDPRVELHTSTQVTGIHGDTALDRVTLSTGYTVDCRGMFCFIGAEPSTDWLTDVATDDHGFVLTGTDVPLAEAAATLSRLGRDPLPFETSVPFVFASGDVRRGSMKRVAAAVGEGSSAVASVHQAFAWVPVPEAERVSPR